jgi:hypothetical protein
MHNLNRQFGSSLLYYIERVYRYAMYIMQATV